MSTLKDDTNIDYDTYKKKYNRMLYLINFLLVLIFILILLKMFYFN